MTIREFNFFIYFASMYSRRLVQTWSTRAYIRYFFFTLFLALSRAFYPVRNR